ncbi:hypothetical protein Goklo_006762 [Gossypium klotzschianum]|uniref:CRIB domain-containing protein n=1 Tax=Gossypium klotzschianum TaxID=34286 RepID=A0A7J8VIS1_9ROSI|nr:hypothetical protein [Gossypium klotzschianum]
MEIGNPTDVKHVAHIGLDSSSDTAPSWMNEFKTGIDSTAKPIRKSRECFQNDECLDHSQPLIIIFVIGVDLSVGSQPATEMTRDRSCTDLPNITKKQKRKKKNPSISKSPSLKSSRISKTKYTQLAPTTDFEM